MRGFGVTNLANCAVLRTNYELDAASSTLGYADDHRRVFGERSGIDFPSVAYRFDQLEGVVLDFSDVSGIDRSAIGVFQRILRRYSDRPLGFYFVHSAANDEQPHSISLDATARRNINYFPSLDHALETAEENLISRHERDETANSCFEFLDHPADRTTFLGYCEPRQVGAGEALCRDGEFSDSIYFVENGSFDIIKMVGDSPLRLAKLSKGAMADEMAFYTGGGRGLRPSSRWRISASRSCTGRRCCACAPSILRWPPNSTTW